MRVAFIDVDGIRTRYTYEGAGYPILLVHGFGVGGDTWLRNIDPLAEHFNVVAPDLLGNGFTDVRPLENGAPHGVIRDHLVGFVEAMGWERFSVVGSSFGALMSVLLYFELPRRVDRLVLVGTGSVFNTDEQVPEMVEGAIRNSLASLEDPTLEKVRQRMANLVYDPRSVPEECLHLQLTSYALPGVPAFWSDAVRGMLGEGGLAFRVLDRLERIEVPTLVIWGREDPRGKYESAAAAVPRLPYGQLVTLERCGHFPFLEQPDRFNALVREFIGSPPGRRPAARSSEP